MTKPTRLAIVVSHPIQHFVHLYRALAREPGMTLRVIYCSRIGVDSYFDRDMATQIAWAGDMLSGYGHEFLPEAPAIRSISFKSVNNPSVGRALDEFAPDAVMVYGYAQLTQLRAIAWSRRHGIPVLMTSDGDAVKSRGAVKSALRNAALFGLFRQVAAFLTVGDQNERMLAAAGVGRAKMFRSPFPIDESVYVELRSRREAVRADVRAHYAIPADAVVALFVGKLAGRKRPADLVAAWDHLSRTGGPSKSLHLLYCGEGAERPALEAAISAGGAQATLAGFVNVDRLPHFFAAADILVHPSEHDPHPLVCSEAAAIGLPMILSDRVGAMGPTDIARDGVNAIGYPCSDVAALAAALAQLIQDQQLRTAMGAASQAVFSQCDIRASVGGVKAALAAVTGRPAAQ